MPFFTAPVGSLRTLWPMGDAVVSQVAGEFGTATTLSTLSMTPMEKVAEVKWSKVVPTLSMRGSRNS